MSLRLGFSRLQYLFHNLNASQRLVKNLNLEFSFTKYPTASLYTSPRRQDLMEFFDSKENWGEPEVQVGRSWKVQELRIKSNSDLHKLWYVLLKEKNMLLTMQHEYEANFKSLPSPERIDKVEESMENLELVVRERNVAYHKLETGETGERPIGREVNCFGLPYKYRKSQHLVEKKYNKKYLENYKLNNVITDFKYVNQFLIKLKEKKKRIKLYKVRKAYKVVCQILKRFPHVSDKALKERFPDVDIEKAKRDPMSRGHFENKY